MPGLLPLADGVLLLAEQTRWFRTRKELGCASASAILLAADVHEEDRPHPRHDGPPPFHFPSLRRRPSLGQRACRRPKIAWYPSKLTASKKVARDDVNHNDDIPWASEFDNVAAVPGPPGVAQGSRIQRLSKLQPINRRATRPSHGK